MFNELLESSAQGNRIRRDWLVSFVQHGVTLACTVAHAETECAARLVGWPGYPRDVLTLDYLRGSLKSDGGFLTVILGFPWLL